MRTRSSKPAHSGRLAGLFAKSRLVHSSVRSAIFISYRRTDAEGDAGRLLAELRTRLPTTNVFMDVYDLSAGQDYVAALDRALTSSVIVIALIGKSWLSAADKHGRRRLDDPADMVRHELGLALERKRIVPVLVQGASLPSADDLPAPLAGLARLQGVELRHARYDDDVTRLARDLRQLLGTSPSSKTRSVGWWVAAPLVAAALGVAGWHGAITRYERFTKIDLAAYGNHGIDWFMEPPQGLQWLHGVPMVIGHGNRAVMTTGTHGRTTWPDEFHIPIETAAGVRRVHLLLQGSWVRLERDRIGQVRVQYRTGEEVSVNLVGGTTIQESWQYDRDRFAAPKPPTLPGVTWRTVLEEPQLRGTDKVFALMDLLTIEVDPTRRIAALRLIDTSRSAGLILIALTVER